MTDLPGLESILYDLAAEMPVNVRKTLNAAIGHGWELCEPGMTVALRFDHPTLEYAAPVYIVWAAGRTPKGALSFKFVSCGTRSLIPLSGAELLEYLEDPTVILPADDPTNCEFHLCDAQQGKTKRPVYVWADLRVYCEKHAKVVLLKVDFDKGNFGPPTDYNPEAPPRWNEEQTPTENLQAQLGATVILDIGHSGAEAPLRVTAPPLRV